MLSSRLFWTGYGMEDAKAQGGGIRMHTIPIYIYICVCVSKYVYMYVFIYIYVCMYLYVFIFDLLISVYRSEYRDNRDLTLLK